MGLLEEQLVLFNYGAVFPALPNTFFTLLFIESLLFLGCVEKKPEG